jgi:beta-glucosidase-like glycosyl hydrolase
MDIYKDKNKSVMDRVEDLVGKMTLREQVAQLTCGMVTSGADSEKQTKEMLANGIGTLSYLNASLTGDSRKDMGTLKEIQRFLVEETRLGIPALAHSEGIAGAQIPGATTFPQSLGLAASWEPELARRMGEVVKKQGGKLGFEGPLVSDYGSIAHAYFRYHTASNPKDTAVKALRAGVDVEQPQNSIFKHLVEAVESGDLDTAYIDKALRRYPQSQIRSWTF